MKKRKIVGHLTKHQALGYYRMVLNGEMTIEEYSKLSRKDIERIITPIYDDSVEEK